MLKNKGFTIIEIISVIGIISLITALIVPSVILIRTKINEKTYETKIEMIEKSSKLYVEDNLNNIKQEIREKLGGISSCTENIPMENGVGCTNIDGNYKYVYTMTIKEIADNGIYKRESSDCAVTNPTDNSCMDDTKLTFYIGETDVVVGYGETLNTADPLRVDLAIEQIEADEDSMSIKITASGPDASSLTEYYYSIANNQYEKSKETTYKFKDLAPGTEYNIKVYAKNKDGKRTSIHNAKMWTVGLSFDIKIIEYQEVELTNVPINFTIKYAQGNQNASYFENNGTDITNTLKAKVTNSSIYTFALINSSEKVVSIKKVYIYNTGDLLDVSSIDISITDSSIKSLEGEAFTHNGTASVTLSDNILTITARQAPSYYTEYYECDCACYCDAGGTLKGNVCVGEDYTVYTRRVATIDCQTYETLDVVCYGNCSNECTENGYSRDYDIFTENITYTECTSSSSTFAQIIDWSGQCYWRGDYYATCYCSTCPIRLYHYTIGVVIN